ncbi:MAG: biotin--[acetyl-CoA-carboxylase] ligase [Bdellovibrionota bacterium]
MNIAEIANTVIIECDSTNSLARKLGETGFPHGTWVAARNQSNGRGRHGRVWVSMEGNLFLSLVMRFKSRSILTWVPLTATVGVIKFLRCNYTRNSFKVKWPNDIVTTKGKIGGVLCEAFPNQLFVVIGIGLNCVSAPEMASSLSVELGAEVTADDVRSGVIESVMSSFDELISNGPSKIAVSYKDWCAIPSGSRIMWNYDCSGDVIGLGPSGELIVKNTNGNTVKLFAEDIRAVRGAYA